MTTTTPVPVSVPGWGQKSTMLAITLIPFAGVLAAVTLLWNNAVGWSDLGLMAILYILMGFGITIGFHRMLTHRAFEAIPPLKATLLVLGSMAIRAPRSPGRSTTAPTTPSLTRKATPHSPHHGFGGGLGGQLKGLLHAHMGWMFAVNPAADVQRYAKNLMRRPDRPLHRPHIPALGGARVRGAVL